MNQIDAVALFEAKASTRAQLVAREDEAVVVRKGYDCLRLRSTPLGIILDITHGSGDGSETFWIDLYSDPVASDSPSLADCIEYGLDLLLPEGEASNEEAEQAMDVNRP